LHRDAATSKIKGFTSVDIFFHPITAVFYLFLPQFCHSELFEFILPNSFKQRQLSGNIRQRTARMANEQNLTSEKPGDSLGTQQVRTELNKNDFLLD
jgi:hypothetical protein